MLLLIQQKEAQGKSTKKAGKGARGSNGIFLTLERDYEIFNATSTNNSIPTDIKGTKLFGDFNGTPQFDTLFNTNIELNLDASVRVNLGNLDSLTSDLTQEITQLQSQGAIYGQDYFLFDNAVVDYGSELSFGGSVEDTFVTPTPNLPSDSGSNNFFTTQGQNVIDIENRFFDFELKDSIAPSININLQTATVLVSKLKLDDELIIGQQDNINTPGAFYRTDELSVCGFRFSSQLVDRCSNSELTEINNLGFNKNNGISFPVLNSLNGQFNPKYITETDDKLLFKYKILIDLGGDADKFFLFVPAFTAPDADGNFNELNPSDSLSLFDFLSFPDSKSGGCAEFNSPDNAICLGAVLDLGTNNNIENKVTQQIDLLDDLTTANTDNPNLILQDTQTTRYRRTNLTRPASDNNEGLFNLRLAREAFFIRNRPIYYLSIS